MRISNQNTYNAVLRDIERVSERMQNAQLQISSGKKVNKLSDDPAGMSDIVRIQGEQGEVKQYLANVATGQSRLDIADSTLQGVQSMVERARNLALLATSNLEGVSSYSTEIAGLREQMLAAANTTFQGQSIFAGSNVDNAAYAKQADGTITYAGNNDVVNLQIGRGTALQTQLTGNSVFSGTIDVFSTLSSLLTAMQTGDKTAIAAQAANLEKFSTQVGGALSRVGGLVNHAQSIQSQLTQYSLAQKSERARLEEADLASSITEFTQAETALRAATAVGAKISEITILDYLR